MTRRAGNSTTRPSPPSGSSWSTVRSWCGCAWNWRGAFFLKGQDGLARRHFELVLAGGVPPAVAANIRAFMNAMQTRKRFTGYFGAAIAPDSNLNAASESEIIYIDTAFGRLPFTRQGDFGAQSGLGLSVWGGGEYQQPLSERLRLRVGADLAQREYGGSDFDQSFLAAHAGPRWLASPITEISLLATAQRQWLGGIPYQDETGVRLELDRRLTARLWARGTAAYRQRDHQQRDFLDGPLVGFHRHLRVDAGAGAARARDGGLRARPRGARSTGATCRAGCGWAPRWPCRSASPSAPASRRGARITTAAARRT